jgi:hypothetical protein
MTLLVDPADAKPNHRCPTRIRFCAQRIGSGIGTMRCDDRAVILEHRSRCPQYVGPIDPIPHIWSHVIEDIACNHSHTQRHDTTLAVSAHYHNWRCTHIEGDTS